MNSNYIIWPVLAQIVLTLTIFIVLGVRKSKAVKAGEINRKKTALNNKAWPEDVVKVTSNIANQFETPVIFYILCLVIYNINAVSLMANVLAWLFVLSRFIHAYIHIGTNHVPMRLRMFLIGCFVLIAMLILVVWKLATS
jgi:hypothetical protein